MNIQQIDIDQLQLDPSQAATAFAKPNAEQIQLAKRVGIVVPIIAHRLKQATRLCYTIIEGGDRWILAQKAGIHRVPVTIRDDLNPHDIQDILRQQTAIMDPIAEALLFETTLDPADKQLNSIAAVARHFKCKRRYVSNALTLLNLHPQIQDMLQTRTITAGKVRGLNGLTYQRQPAALAQILARQMSTREAEAYIKQLKQGGDMRAPSNNQATAKDPDTIAFETQYSELLGCRVLIDQGKLVIDYDGNLEILDGILEHIH